MGTFDYSNFSRADAVLLREISGHIRALVRRTIPLIIEIGDHLTKAKEHLPHGSFGLYCIEELGICLRSAENYMGLAELAKVHSPNLLSRLPARAGYKLAKKSTPAALVAEIMSEISAGRTLTLKEVECRVAAAKPAQPSDLVSDVDTIAGQLLRALHPDDIVQLTRFLRSAKRTAISVLCGRLQQGLSQLTNTSTAAALLPHPEL